MRIIGHSCARVTVETAGRDFTVYCECGATFVAHHRPDVIDSFVAHVVAQIAANALDRERSFTAGTEQGGKKRGRFRVI